MSKKIAVLMAEGYEESETMTIVDLLRRLGFTVTTFACQEDLYVLGMQGMVIKADEVFSEIINEYDMIILPGGSPGGENLKNNPLVIKTLQTFNEQKKYIGAMCSGTTVLEAANVILGRKVTGYLGYETKLLSGEFVHEVAVADENLITSVGPATPYPFAFKIASYLGVEVQWLKDRLLYDFAKGR